MPIRNIAIIAHVDHGKTTLVDQMFAQSGAIRSNQHVEERALDSNDLERERGITILAKVASVAWNDTRINIVDTPGHADFGGEVERILSMVDGVILLVDASEGPMPQTKFVTQKALALGLKPIVVINKIDKPDQRADEVHDEVFDLFVALEANDEQLDFPMLYASGRDGWASTTPEKTDNLDALFELVVSHVERPSVFGTDDEPVAVLATTLEADPFLGRILTGRIERGTLRVNETIKALSHDGTEVERARITKILAFRGLNREPVDEARAGDIVAIAGFKKASVADTLTALTETQTLLAPPIDPPTISMSFSINTSPLSGQEGKKVQSRVIRDRLLREAEGNVAITITETGEKDAFDVAGRGELQLGVLIETMRREGFELSISRPRVIYRDDDNGNRMEPIEEVTVDVDNDLTGVVIEKLTRRKGTLIDMRASGVGRSRIILHCPSRSLIGYHGEFLTDTRGTGIMHRLFHEYGPYKGPIEGRRVGVLVSNSDGAAVPYALFNLEDRGYMFIHAGVRVYQGMIIGEHSRDNDLDVNPLKGKQLNNIRASGKDEAVRLTTPRIMSLEQAIAYIQEDELVEVTPQSIRLRKRYLIPHERKKAKAQMAAG
jgi:GTP-binding protein